MTAYGQAMLVKYDHLEQVVGIGADPPRPGQTSSQDLMYIRLGDLTEKEKQEIQEHSQELGIMKTGYTERLYDGQEYPEVPVKQEVFVPGRNRKERRRNLAKLKRKMRQGS